MMLEVLSFTGKDTIHAKGRCHRTGLGGEGSSTATPPVLQPGLAAECFGRPGTAHRPTCVVSSFRQPALFHRGTSHSGQRKSRARNRPGSCTDESGPYIALVQAGSIITPMRTHMKRQTGAEAHECAKEALRSSRRMQARYRQTGRAGKWMLTLRRMIANGYGDRKTREHHDRFALRL